MTKKEEQQGMVRVLAWTGKIIYDYVKRSHLRRLIEEGYVIAVVNEGGLNVLRKMGCSDR